MNKFVTNGHELAPPYISEDERFGATITLPGENVLLITKIKIQIPTLIDINEIRK